MFLIEKYYVKAVNECCGIIIGADKLTTKSTRLSSTMADNLCIRACANTVEKKHSTLPLPVSFWLLPQDGPDAVQTPLGGGKVQRVLLLFLVLAVGAVSAVAVAGAHVVGVEDQGVGLLEEPLEHRLALAGIDSILFSTVFV